MIYQNEYVKEETILEPHKTQWRVDGWITDVDYLYSPNRYKEYIVKWQPLTHNDHQNLHEQLQQAIGQVQLSIGPYSNKVATPMYEDDMGQFYCSQLFMPKLNIEVPHPSELLGKTATFSGHIRELPLGQVVLQLDYLDVDDFTNGIDEPVKETICYIDF